MRGGVLGGVRVLCAVEEHGNGKQLLRVRAWPRYSLLAGTLVPVAAGLAIGAALENAWPAAVVLGVLAVGMIWRMLRESTTSMVLQACERIAAE